MKQFDTLCETFGIEGNPEKDIKDAIAPDITVPEPSSEFIEYKGQKYTLESLRYQKALLQEKIANDNGVLETMREMCKIGAPPRMFEVYSTLSNTVASHIKQLTELEKIETDYRVIEEKEKLTRENMANKQKLLSMKQEASSGNTYNIQNNNTVVLSQADLEAMIEKADEEANINTAQIEPKFDLS